MHQRPIRYLLPLAACLILAPPAQAKQLYKFQDEQGRWHFSDTPPATERPVETQTIDVEHKDKISINRRGPEADHALYIYNSYHGPVEVTLSFSQASNVDARPPLPHRFLVPARQEIQAVSLRMADKRRGFAYHIGATALLGDSRAVPDTTASYRPPFDGGKTFIITQAFFGQYSHNTPYSEYAVDIAMPEGTAVVAARDGVVMDIERDFFGNGMNLEKYGSRANHVRILHEDGSMAEYGHLKLEGVRVVPGARVAAGQVIGESGNTGFSSGPHLHFSVQYNDGKEMRSLPFQFRLRDGGIITPRAGLRLTGY